MNTKRKQKRRGAAAITALASSTRRGFIKQAVLTASGLLVYGYWGTARSISPNEKLNIGAIGVAGRAGDDLKEVSGQNIVALCDIDDHNLAAAAQKHSG